ncbi:hypothetical protein CYMTET_47121 [Cymbomonas tetramitiformis]|uniref:Uncharacterized protein n=1 Tax=Cymbomonas tetramitiformis TaxID=36881 RepID=A0AAE0BUX1_9CHLO|nr:hypothetical protein CYMTET_47121 [Cymbomonas tetramitiformis]
MLPAFQKSLQEILRLVSSAPRRHRSQGRFLFKNRLNVDQVPLPFVVGDYEHTIEEKGAQNVWIRQPGSGLEKRQANLQIAIRAGKDAEGNNLSQPPIAILFRGTGKRIPESERAAYHPDVHVYFQKCAWVDRDVAVRWLEGTMIPWINENLQGEESVFFADNLDAQIQPEYTSMGREVKRDVDHMQNEWLEIPENLERWESNNLTASNRRILMTWWAGDGYKRACGRVNIDRYFEKSGCKITVTGDGDGNINPEGIETFVFDRPVIPSVLVETPSQGVLQAASHEQIEAEVQEREIQMQQREIQMQQEEDEEEFEGEDEDSEDEGEQKWFVPARYSAIKETPDCEVSAASVGKHLVFKFGTVGWCHGWVTKFYPAHRRGYNVEIAYGDGDRRDHILHLDKYALGDTTCVGSWCLLKAVV